VGLAATEESAPVRVVVADDNDGFRKAIADLLGHAGFAVTSVADGDALFARALAERPDVIVLDVRMPGAGVFDVLRRLRSANVSSRVVIATAHADPHTRAEASALEIEHVLEKPFTFDALMDAIRAG
jgi:CheY-like chemotaxis protein